jgi:hypothetical protein
MTNEIEFIWVHVDFPILASACHVDISGSSSSTAAMWAVRQVEVPREPGFISTIISSVNRGNSILKLPKWAASQNAKYRPGITP